MVIFFAIQFAVRDIDCGVAIDPMMPPIPAGVGKFCAMLKNWVIAVRAREVVMRVGMRVRILRFGFLRVFCW